MVRGAASSHRDDQDGSQTQNDSKVSKRRCVQSACVPCRKRKSKCDGGTPVCATCTAVYKTDCHYDAESESRRSKPGPSNAAITGTKRDASVVVGSSSQDAFNAEYIINSLRRLPEEHVNDFLQHIRRDPKADIATLAETWHKSMNLSLNASVELPSLESDLSVLFGKPAVTLTGESRYFGHSAGLGLVLEDEDFAGGRVRTNSALPERQGTTWTNVTSDLTFVNKLLKLYFTWSHPFFVLFSRECFYKDFEAGRDKYCSSLLVNAICAYACHLTNDPAGRTDPNNFRTAGDHFFAEARRSLFEEDDIPSLTTTQALCVMAMREPSMGRDSTGFRYMGRCMRMCVELGLHLNNSASPALNLTPSEVEVRKVTFWGCFTMDTVYSVCLGRIASLPRAAITLDKPILEESTNQEGFLGASRMPQGSYTTRMFLQEFASLSELINDNNYMYYAPKERVTSSRLLSCYEKYQKWYARLPAALRIEGKEKPDAHILVLHMLYYTTIVHLFSPMLKVNLIHSDVHPREACIDAANNVSHIIKIYRSLYDFRVAHLLIPHILLSVCIIHLLHSKDSIVSRQNLVDGLRGLEDVQECHYFGARSFRIIYSLAKTWDLPWPKELEHSELIPSNHTDEPRGTLSPPTDPLLVAPNTITTSSGRMASGMAYSPVGHPHRRESLSMFAQTRMQIPTHPDSVASGKHHHSPVTHAPIQNAYGNNMPLPSYPYSQSIPGVPANCSTTVTTSPVSSGAEAMFWTPLPGMPGPISPRNKYQQLGPMGLGTVLQSSDMGERLGRDGFKINEDWRSSHVNAFNSGPGGAVFGAPNDQPSANYVHRNSYVQPSDSVTYQHTPPDGQEEFVPAWWQNANGNPGQMS